MIDFSAIRGNKYRLRLSLSFCEYFRCSHQTRWNLHDLAPKHAATVNRADFSACDMTETAAPSIISNASFRPLLPNQLQSLKKLQDFFSFIRDYSRCEGPLG